MIQIENLSKVFRTSEVETIALNHVNIEVKEGEFVAIMGSCVCCNRGCVYGFIRWGRIKNALC